MMHASPGVYFETVDYSTYAAKLSKTILALVGKTVKGPSTPTYISKVRQYLDTFGVPRTGEYSALAAVSYLEQGNALWFSRLVGSDAVKASVEIPKAYEIEDEVVANAADGKSYIYSATLNNEPIPGTIKITVADPNDSTVVYSIVDSVNGVFSPVTNANIAEYPNFIDYDTGSFRFTLDNVVPTNEISIQYNYREVDVVNTLIYTVETVNEVDYKYSGILSHPNIIVDDDFSITVNTKTFVKDGDPVENVYNLTDGESLVGTINSITGAWELTFAVDDNLIVTDKIYANYTYMLYKVKTLGVIGTDGVAEAFIDSLNAVVVPESVSILVDGVSVATDNGEGGFTGDIVDCTNTVDYTTKAIEFALVTPPEDDFTIKVSYTAKYNHVIFTATEETVGGTKSATLTHAPVIKNSVTVTIGSDILTDDGEGLILGNGANGTIDYDTGLISINFTQTLAIGGTITATYLQKIGEANSLAYGSFYNGITLEFYNDQYNGYGLKVWNSEQSTTNTPEENWKDLEFDSPLSSKYFMSKIASSLIEIELSDETSTAAPILNTKLVLSGGTSDTDNISDSDAVNALDEFANAESYDINLVACPDFPGNKTVINKLISLCEVQRGDCFAIVDPPQNYTVQNVVNWHNGDGQWASENSLNSSFAALYYPWVMVSNNFTESNEWVPPSVKIVSMYAFSDSRSDVWFAPAGLNRGKLFNVLKTERVLNVNDRDLLYSTGTNAVNPICNFVGDGIVVFGQKTLQRKSSALDRVNVMRLMLYITKILATSTKYLLFEPHDQLTWLLYKQLVNPVFEDIKGRRGLYEFRVVCDETTNTPYYIDNNTLVAEVWLKPTKTTERIINRFIVTSTGANFDELISAV